MSGYRKSLDLDPEAEYTFVVMGQRDRLNGPASYPFPTPDAAQRFAFNHKQRDPHRDVKVVYPDGREVQL